MLALQRNSSLPQPYSAINPYTFAEPTSPHIVSADEGRAIDAAVLSRGLQNAGVAGELGVDRRGGRLVYTALCHADVCRLGTDGTAAGDSGFVGVKLGCINHAMLTALAVEQAGLPLVRMD